MLKFSLLFSVLALCKSTKSTEEDVNYEEDTPVEEDDEDQGEDDNNDTAEPQILSQGQSIRVQAGSTVILPCQMIHIENYAFTWSKDDKILYFETLSHIKESNRIVLLPNNSLAIYNATVSDSSDDYKCNILRQPESIHLTHRLRVDPERTHQQSATSPPPQHSHKGIIRVIPPSRLINAKQGDTIQFGCETDTQPPLEIKWFFMSKKVNGDDPNVILKDNYITIKKVNSSHSALFQCLAEDGSKTPAMEAINVIVQYIPEIEVKKNKVHTGESIESEMQCIVSAYPEAIIKWYKDGKEITHKKGSVVMHHSTTKGNKTRHILKILHTSKKDFGEYKCRAQNLIGEDTKSIVLTGVPSQAKVVSAEVLDDNNAIILKWHLESYSPIKEYKLQYRRNGEETWNFVEPEVKEGNGNQFIVEHPIKDLQPGSYEAILMARNVFGWSMPSEPHSFTGDYPSEMAQKGNLLQPKQTPADAMVDLLA
ncbi:Neurotrimin [Camponotus floridanus]|uniref:Neurotrimin n=1 Tax=Camponotus floridanus TaxID=104421 RepID=E2ACI8_CAMFO|nr:Neurotrimin [Camponotus floridanus]